MKKTAKKAAKKTVRKAAKKAPKKAAKKAVSRKTAKKTTGSKKKTPKTSKATKKTSKKNVKQKLEVYNLAQDAPGERFFLLANGQPVKHVAELAEIVTDLEEHIFNHHVNPENNDFHNWVKDVFKDLELAKKILGVQSKEQLQLTIYKHAAHKAFQKR